MIYPEKTQTFTGQLVIVTSAGFKISRHVKGSNHDVALVATANVLSCQEHQMQLKSHQSSLHLL